MLRVGSRAFWMILFAAAACLASPLAAGAHGQLKKVKICHVPPGHPRERQTIVVWEQAVSHHLRHGDSIGACPTGCEADPSICDDQSLCTSDACSDEGECVHTPVDCNDGNACTADSCNPASGCVSDPAPRNGAACDDLNACTGGEACQNAICAGAALPDCCLSDLDCNDLNLCTTDHCVANACVSAPKDCSLGEVCGIPGFSDACVVSFCNESDGSCATTPVDCDDGNLCTVDYCNAGSGCGSVPTLAGPEEPAELSCDDGLDNDCDGAADAADPDCIDTCTSASDCPATAPPICTQTGIASSTLTTYTAVCSGGACGVQETTHACFDAQCAQCEDTCAPGSTETQACGFCGTQSRVCGENRLWGAWGACEAPGVCQPGVVDDGVCGQCLDGSRFRTCTATCEWGPFGACIGAFPGPICP